MHQLWSNFWNNTIATTAENLKFHSKWAVRSTVHLPHIKIDCFICETGNTHSTCIRTFTWRWVVGEVNYFEMLDWFPFFPRKKFLVNSLERTCCFLKQERTLEIGFSQSCVCTIFILVDNLPMQNELTFAS